MKSKDQILEDVLQELKDVKIQLNQINSRGTKANENATETFLLEEIKELGEFWRHTDKRLESGLNLFFTGGAVLVTASIYFIQNFENLNEVLISLIPIAIGFLVFGFVLTRRISNTFYLKSEYIISINLIRGYFVSKNQELNKVLFLPSINIQKDGFSYKQGITTNSKVVQLFTIVNSILLGAITTSISYIIFPKLMNFVFVIIFGVITITSMIFFHFRVRSLVRKHEGFINRRIEEIKTVLNTVENGNGS